MFYYYYIYFCQNRSRHKNERKRKKAKECSINAITNCITTLYEDRNKSPTTLFELSKQQYKRMKSNSIHVSGMTKSKEMSKGPDHILYSNVTYGVSVSITKKKVAIGKNMWYKYINLAKTKRRYCLITAEKNECKQLFPNTHIFGSSMTDLRQTNVNDNAELSGIVVLMISTLPLIRHNPTIERVWDEDMFKMVKSCKANVMATYDHHGSFGNCFSFGNKPLYGMVDNKSVGVYSNKKSKVIRRQEHINVTASNIETICSEVIKKGVNSLSAIVPDIKYLLSPILDTAQKIGKSMGDTVLSEVNTATSGCWNAFLYVDGRTEQLHTERDCAYTLITVPLQVVKADIPLCHKPLFLFKLGDSDQLVLPLLTNTSFLYNGNFVTHRQAYDPKGNPGDRSFYNISSYGNQKIFNHLRCTFARIAAEKKNKK